MVDRPQLGRVGVWSGPLEPELAALVDDLGFGALWIGRSPSGHLAGIEQTLDHRLPERTATTLTRRLNDGREFEIVKVFYELGALRARLARLGWAAEVHQTPAYFLYGLGTGGSVAEPGAAPDRRGT